jgi:two-component system alkaline phosphatase synthesis response regulator PhoP
MIFCVEDDASARDLMTYTLSASSFEAEGFSDGKALFEALSHKRPSLIILDIMLPGEDGLSILKKLRSKPTWSDIPVIIASAKGTEYDKVIGLDLGADDYLAKPFGMMEMLSRVKAVLRRSAPGKSEKTLALGLLSLNTAEHTVTVGKERVNLTLKEYDLLEKFMTSPCKVFTREQLLVSVWGADFSGETRTVDVHIGTLRTKLGECGKYIETVRGLGYRIEEKE